MSQNLEELILNICSTWWAVGRTELTPRAKLSDTSSLSLFFLKRLMSPFTDSSIQ